MNFVNSRMDTYNDKKSNHDKVQIQVMVLLQQLIKKLL